jgi:GGDEF domain-containing protein
MKKFFIAITTLILVFCISIPITYFFHGILLELINKYDIAYIGIVIFLLVGYIYDIARRSTLRPKIKREKSGALKRDLNIIREEIERSQRYNYTMSIITMQIEGLDGLQDKYESPIESIIFGLVGQLKSLVRYSDILMRFRTDQILIILPNTDHLGSQLVSQKLASYINSNEINGFQINVTVGYAQYFNNGSVENLIEEASSYLKGENVQ